MRTFAIVVGVIVAALALVISSGWYWWHVHGGSVVASGRAALDDGRRRGAAVDETGCLAEVLQRKQADREGDFGAVLARSLWLEGCLGTSRAAASFCVGVPPPHEFIDTSNWIAAACTQHGVSDPGCQSLYQQVAKYCVSPRRAGKLGRPEPQAPG